MLEVMIAATGSDVLMNHPLPSVIYPSQSSLPATLKRTRSEESKSRKFDASRLPLLPRISGDVALQVFTHISLRRPNVSPADYGDNERLVDLGRSIFGLAVTHILFDQRPSLRAAEISIFSSAMVEDWVSTYRLRSKILCQPELHSTLKSPKETLNLFHAYIGGLYVSSGPQVVNNWIRALLEPELEFLCSAVNTSPHGLPKQETPPPKRVKSEDLDPTLPLRRSSFFTPPPASRQPNPLPRQAMSIPSNPLAPAQPDLPFLPLFNQTAMQRRVTVEYISEFSGASHAPRWAVKCVVNGICKGEGSGVSKRIAQEEAARKAYYSMGWT